MLKLPLSSNASALKKPQTPMHLFDAGIRATGDKLSTSHVNRVAPGDCKHTESNAALQHLDSLNSACCDSLLSSTDVNTGRELQQLTLYRPPVDLCLVAAHSPIKRTGRKNNSKKSFKYFSTCVMISSSCVWLQNVSSGI